MTLSEYVQAQRIAALLRGDESEADAEPLECGNGLRLAVNAGRVRACYPRSDEGPWVAFDVRRVSGPLPDGWREESIVSVMTVSAVVALLKSAGWPRALAGSVRKARAVPGAS